MTIVLPFKKMKTDRQFLPFEEAKRVVHALGLKNSDDCARKRPPEIPRLLGEAIKYDLKKERKNAQYFCLMKKRKRLLMR